MALTKIENDFPFIDDSQEMIFTKEEPVINDSTNPEKNEQIENDSSNNISKKYPNTRNRKNTQKIAFTKEENVINPEKKEPTENTCEKSPNTENIKNDDEVLNDIKPRQINQIFLQEYTGVIRTNKKRLKKVYSCIYPGCKETFTKKFAFDVHGRMHTGERPFVCKYENCDKAYARKEYLKRHKRQQHSHVQTYMCNICHTSCSTASNLTRHHIRKHNPLCLEEKNTVCEVCFEEFSTRKVLKVHMLQVHDRKMYKCNFCTKTFSEPSVLQRHLNSNVHKNFNCSICLISVLTYQELKNHLRNEHRESYTEYTCDICKTKFRYKCNLKFHLRDHYESNVIVCPHEGCTRIYYFQRNLDIHIRTNHLGMKWNCPICPAKLSSKQKLNAHIDKIHENPTPKKPPAKGDKRKMRGDAGFPHKSAVTDLAGLASLPRDVEREIIFRHELKDIASSLNS